MATATATATLAAWDDYSQKFLPQWQELAEIIGGNCTLNAYHPGLIIVQNNNGIIVEYSEDDEFYTVEFYYNGERLTYVNQKSITKLSTITNLAKVFMSL